MKIVCLGWGSLIWNSGELKIPKSKWNVGGPFLQIEFSRISSDDRVTLVIDENAEVKEVRVLWAKLKNVNNLDDAIYLLAKREGTKCKNIHYSINGKIHKDVSGRNKKKIVMWQERKKLDVVIWTGLKPKNRSGNRRSSVDDIIQHLNSLDQCDKKRAEEYIRRTPIQIDTIYRKRIEAEFNWTPTK